MTTIKPEFSYSKNNEVFHGSFDSREQALEEAIELYAEDDFLYLYIGENQSVQNQMFCPDADIILEHMTEQACEYLPEFSESYIDDLGCMSNEKKKELSIALDKTICNFLELHDIRPLFFKIKNVETHLRKSGKKVIDPLGLTWEAPSDLAEGQVELYTEIDNHFLKVIAKSDVSFYGILTEAKTLKRDDIDIESTTLELALNEAANKAIVISSEKSC